MKWVYAIMNYKQCLEFLELNTENKDLSEQQYNHLRARLQIQSRAGKKMICLDTATHGLFPMVYLERALKEAGIKCMVFSKRVLEDYRARWRCGGKMISQKTLCEIIEKIGDFAEDKPSLYQIELLAAEMAFGQSGAEVLLLEKEDADRLTFAQEDRLDLESLHMDKSLSYKIRKKNLKRQTIETHTHKNVQLGTLGQEAAKGACQVLEWLPILQEKGLDLEEKHLRKAMEDTYVTPAFGMVCTKPLVFVDDTTTGQQADRLIEDIETYLTDKPVVMVWGATKETKTGEMLQAFCPRVSYILTVAPPGKNRIPSYDLAQEILGTTPNVTAVDSLEEAYEIIKMILPKDGVVLVVGNLQLLRKYMSLIEDITHK